MLTSVDRQFTIAIFATFSVVLGCWLASEIPVSPETTLRRLEPVFVIEADHNHVERVIFTTINWLDVNKGGMAFGILLAASLMTLLASVQRRRFHGRFMNTVMGTVIGLPLRVAVNRPELAKRLYTGGAPPETALATMISAPTINAIALAVLIAVFPWYVVLTKLALTLALILVGIPILSWLLLKQPEPPAVNSSAGSKYPAQVGTDLGEQTATFGDAANPPRWPESLRRFVKSFCGHLWYVTRISVPLIVLAGLLGSVAAIAIPWDNLTGMLPFEVRSNPLITNHPRVIALMLMGGFALFGALLRLPVAFDAVIVAALLAAGMPVRYAMVLLFTLGIFSFYSFRGVWTQISRPVAVLLFFAVTGSGVIAGVAAHYTSLDTEVRQSMVLYEAFFGAVEAVERPTYSAPEGVEDSSLVAELRQAALKVDAATANASTHAVSVASIPLAPRSSGAARMFTRLDAATLGIDEPSPFSLFRHVSPRYWGRGVATGDVHNDGWPDILIASDNISVRGISLYANRQGNDFVKQRIDIPLLDDLEVLNVALVDINNDGWLDIFISAYRGGNHIIYNREGRFTSANVQTLPDYGSVLAAAVSFGDVDTDGDLDIFLGNWTIGYLRGVLPGEPVLSRNALLLQDQGNFVKKDLEAFPGETLVSLLSDINGDGNLDLIVGNDFAGSDVYYFGDGAGSFEEISFGSGIIPHTTDSTMSVHTADVNNDLVPEIYLDQIARAQRNYEFRMKSNEELCEEIGVPAERARCVEEMKLDSLIDQTRAERDALRCLSIADALLREDCMVLHVLWDAWMLEEPDFCEMVPPHRAQIRIICHDIFGEHVRISGEAAEAALPQIVGSNVFLVRDDNGNYADRASEMGLAIGGWGWNAKFADVDNDEWQDIYVANGMAPRALQETNYFFHNQKGQVFAERTEETGLVDFRSVGGYSYVDFDNDGDLDIVSVPVHGPIRLFVNNTDRNNSIMFELRDDVGNHFSIGGKIIIHYGPDGSKHQMREIQAGGGFISFDAPIAHFGLGEHDRVGEVEVQWSDGPSVRLNGPYEAGMRYVITRRR